MEKSYELVKEIIDKNTFKNFNSEVFFHVNIKGNNYFVQITKDFDGIKIDFHENILGLYSFYKNKKADYNYHEELDGLSQKYQLYLLDFNALKENQVNYELVDELEDLNINFNEYFPVFKKYDFGYSDFYIEDEDKILVELLNVLFFIINLDKEKFLLKENKINKSKIFTISKSEDGYEYSYKLLKNIIENNYKNNIDIIIDKKIKEKIKLKDFGNDELIIDFFSLGRQIIKDDKKYYPLIFIIYNSSKEILLERAVIDPDDLLSLQDYFVYILNNLENKPKKIISNNRYLNLYLKDLIKEFDIKLQKGCIEKLIKYKFRVIKSNIDYNKKLLEYCIALTNFYGVISFDRLIEIFNEYNNEDIDKEDILEIIYFANDKLQNNFVYNNYELLITESQFYQKDYLEILKNRNGDLYYKLDKDEVLKYLDNNYFDKTRYYIELEKYLVDNFNLKYSIKDIMIDINVDFQLGFEWDSFLRNIKDSILGKINQTQSNKLFDFYGKLYKETRLWRLNGYTLDEFEKLQEKIENIGRNDLCYCGSGEKYKYCCLDK